MKNKLDDILAADLRSFAYICGYTQKVREKSSTNWSVLENPATGDKVMIHNKGNNGVMYYRNTDPGLDQDQGNIVNFCINRRNGSPIPTPKPTKEEFREAFTKLKAFIGQPEIEPPSFSPAQQQKQKKSPGSTRLRERTQLANTYLLEKRGIDPSILDLPLWAGTVGESEFILPTGKAIYNTAFIKRLPDGKQTGHVTHFYSAKTQSHQKVVNETGEEGLFLSNFLPGAQTLFIGESSIDCLSHFQINRPEKAHYISYEGQISPTKISLVNQIFDTLGKPSHINSITDNDYSGHIFDLQLAVGVHNHFNPNNTIQSLQERDITKYVLKASPDMALEIKEAITAIFDKETTIHEKQHLKPYLNIGYTKDICFFEFPRDPQKKLFRFMTPLTTAILGQNHIAFKKEYPPNLREGKRPTKDWNEFLTQSKKKSPEMKKNQARGQHH